MKKTDSLFKELHEANEEIKKLNNELADAKAKIIQATTFLTGLKDTPDSSTIGNLRSFIDVNYTNITKC